MTTDTLPVPDDLEVARAIASDLRYWSAFDRRRDLLQAVLRALDAALLDARNNLVERDHAHREVAELTAALGAKFPGAPILGAEYMAMQERAEMAEAASARARALAESLRYTRDFDGEPLFRREDIRAAIDGRCDVAP